MDFLSDGALILSAAIGLARLVPTSGEILHSRVSRSDRCPTSDNDTDLASGVDDPIHLIPEQHIAPNLSSGREPGLFGSAGTTGPHRRKSAGQFSNPIGVAGSADEMSTSRTRGTEASEYSHRMESSSGVVIAGVGPAAQASKSRDRPRRPDLRPARRPANRLLQTGPSMSVRCPAHAGWVHVDVARDGEGEPCTRSSRSTT